MQPTVIKIMGEPSLLEKSTPIDTIDDSLPPLIETLIATMQAKKGIGIAAPQIGVNKRLMKPPSL